MASEVKFNKGTEVEVRSDEPGFEGSWYTATVLRFLSRTGCVSVEYDNLLSEDDESKKLKATVKMVYVRPRPPVETDAVFEPGDKVDAFHNDGWWDGTVKEAAGDSRYVVHFDRTGEEMEFGRSELRHTREWVDGKWASKDKPEVFVTPQNVCGIKSAGHEQWQAGDVTKKPEVAIDPGSSEEARDGYEDELLPDSLISALSKTVGLSPSAGVESARSSKKSKKGNEIQDNQTPTEAVKPFIGVEVQSDVAVSDKEVSGANILKTKKQLKRCDQGLTWRNRKASSGKNMKQQTEKGAGRRRGRPKTKALTEVPMRDMEYKASDGRTNIQIVEQDCQLNKSEMLAPGLLDISHEKNASPSPETEELSHGKGGLPLDIDHNMMRVEEPLSNNEGNNQVNESQPISEMFEQITERNALHKDFEDQKLNMVVHSSFTRLEDFVIFGIQSNEASSSKDQDAIHLQSLGGQVGPSKGVTLDKRSHMIGPAQDRNTSLPFVKSSPVWKIAESMEAFHIMPQHPHFHLLEQHCEEYREAMALGYMLTFANLVASKSNTQLVDPPSVLENRLKALDELEGHGFDVQQVRGRLKEMLDLKNKLQMCEEKGIVVERQILEREQVKDRLHTDINLINKEIHELEQHLLLLNRRKESILKQSESNDHETAKLRKELHVTREECCNVKNDFHVVTTSPW